MCIRDSMKIGAHPAPVNVYSVEYGQKGESFGERMKCWKKQGQSTTMLFANVPPIGWKIQLGTVDPERDAKSRSQTGDLSPTRKMILPLSHASLKRKLRDWKFHVARTTVSVTPWWGLPMVGILLSLLCRLAYLEVEDVRRSPPSSTDRSVLFNGF